MTEQVKTENREDIAIITLDNPKTRNALSLDVRIQLDAALKRLRHDSTCRAIVLCGAGGHFCSGGDISGMREERTLPMGRERMELGHSIVREIVGGTKPVIAAVDGYAAGAGLSLAACSDYVAIGPTARFIASFGKVGLIPDMGLLWSLPARIGLAQAKRMFTSARIVAAAEAVALGLADRLVESGDTLAAAIELAHSFTVAAPLSVALMKSAYASGMATLDDCMRYELDNQSALYLTHDHREGVAAFFEKRAARFAGK